MPLLFQGILRILRVGDLPRIKDIFAGTLASVRSCCGIVSTFPVTIGLHDGSTLSPYLFVLIMDELICNVQENVPWCLVFVDDIVLFDEKKTLLSTKLELLRKNLEDKGLKICKTKREHM